MVSKEMKETREITVIDKLQGSRLRIRISRVGTETIVIPVDIETYNKARLGSVGTINLREPSNLERLTS